ncbi:MAG: hypothetical protein BWY66_01962 [bacterium ADurb.Bin374]|nr:MAG: hypothetical protein BWY66_01962 [bacterium ADurb.Bin374]
MLEPVRSILHTLPEGANGVRRGLSLIEMIIVVSVISILALMALPTVELFDMKTRERMLRDRLYDMRLAIDHYRNARMDNLPPPSVASLLNVIPEYETRSRATEGPFLTLGQTSNPFTPNDDLFIWELRFVPEPAIGTWIPVIKDMAFDCSGSRLFDVRYPEDPNTVASHLAYLKTGFDGTLFKDW